METCPAFSQSRKFLRMNKSIRFTLEEIRNEKKIIYILAGDSTMKTVLTR